jgi:hypothetical protein
MSYGRLSLSFHLTWTFQSSFTSKFEANLSCQTQSPFSGERVFYVRRLLSNRRSLLYQYKHIRSCELIASVQNDKSKKVAESSSFHWTKVFIPDSMKIDKKICQCLVGRRAQPFGREFGN